ncbi:glutathione peroxidase [Sandaracinobacter sp. RS1-74]|uniref:glutathione peroxidase n=1 Tax=Sandaracinobacteroides sayramensis TaxID=2913411 RepID=UPI001EDA19D2|nr:glutathione peroxidase [Sandaracinobacteroides sayramensis]MCG2841425.1 glutathione peroxidase [Sandaracinobacteroides sayramensis]
MADDIYHHRVRMLDGREVSLADYRGQVLLIVNVASRCGFTPQYTGLEELYQRFRDKGFTVLGFPCNQFGKQEPGDAAEIAKFCSTTYPVTFPVFDKIEVNGENAHPLYEQVKAAAPGLLGSTTVKWNFTKFLVNREGEAVERFAPTMKPADIAPKIAKLLSE